MSRMLALVSLAILATGCGLSRGRPPLLSLIEDRSAFHVVDMLTYNGKPDVGDLGMLAGTGTGVFWKPGESHDHLNEAVFREEILKYKDYRGLFYVDLEEWPICEVPDSVSRRSVAMLSRAADLVREVAPNLTFGIYGALPAPNGYWPVVGVDKARGQAWRDCNTRLMEVGRKVDVIFPSIYTNYTDEAGWRVYAAEQLEASRIFGKPVFAFVWPEYHESNEKLSGKHMPADVWRRQLEFIRANGADGVVLWNGWRRPWDDRATWWLETRAFVEKARRR